MSSGAVPRRGEAAREPDHERRAVQVRGLVRGGIRSAPEMYRKIVANVGCFGMECSMLRAGPPRRSVSLNLKMKPRMEELLQQYEDPKLRNGTLLGLGGQAEMRGQTLIDRESPSCACSALRSPY